MAVQAPIERPETETREREKVAPRWRVILHNDHVTTFAFVIEMLVQLFHKKPEEALQLTHEVHNSGSAMVVVTNFERAELYVEQVRSLARPRGFPLTATMEPE